jgi:hypothetical protein
MAFLPLPLIDQGFGIYAIMRLRPNVFKRDVIFDQCRDRKRYGSPRAFLQVDFDEIDLYAKNCASRLEIANPDSGSKTGVPPAQT